MAKTLSILKDVDGVGQGFYKVSTTVPLAVSQAANGVLFAMRFADASLATKMVLLALRLEFQQTSATATAAILDERFQCFVARGWSVADSAGTLLTLTANNAKKSTNMGATLATIRVSASAAGVTAGTRTLDANPFLELQTNIIAAAPTATPYPTSRKELEYEHVGDHPFVFKDQEGFIVQGPTTIFGAAGTANLIVEATWAEIMAYAA